MAVPSRLHFHTTSHSTGLPVFYQCGILYIVCYQLSVYHYQHRRDIEAALVCVTAAAGAGRLAGAMSVPPPPPPPLRRRSARVFCYELNPICRVGVNRFNEMCSARIYEMKCALWEGFIACWRDDFRNCVHSWHCVHSNYLVSMGSWYNFGLKHSSNNVQFGSDSYWYGIFAGARP